MDTSELDLNVNSEGFDPTSAIVHDTLKHISLVLPFADVDPDHLLAMVLHLLGTYSPEETASLVVDHLLEHTRASSPDDHPQHLGANSSDPGPSVEAPEDPTTRLPHELDFKADNDVDCECCFVPSPSTHMLRCPDGHPFCFRCVETHVATQVGQQKIDVVCMYSGDAGCHLRFTLDVLQAQLPEPLLTTYLRLIQQKELKEANLEGLEECPFCDFACVMEIPLRVMPTLSCGNVEHCGVQSCRICRLKAHPGRTCEDTQGDGDQDGRLAIEEAMTRALVRMCPSCGTPFVKEDGCNKMTCPSCGAFSCYVCKEPVRGYGHFEGHDNIYGEPTSNPKCPLWDKVEERHDREVNAAYQRATVRFNQGLPIDDEIQDLDPLPEPVTLNPGIPEDQLQRMPTPEHNELFEGPRVLPLGGRLFPLFGGAAQGVPLGGRLFDPHAGASTSGGGQIGGWVPRLQFDQPSGRSIFGHHLWGGGLFPQPGVTSLFGAPADQLMGKGSSEPPSWGSSGRRENLWGGNLFNCTDQGNGAMIGDTEGRPDESRGEPMDIVDDDVMTTSAEAQDPTTFREDVKTFNSSKTIPGLCSGEPDEAHVPALRSGDPDEAHDDRLQRAALILAKDDATKARRRLRYAEKKLGEVESALYLAQNGDTGGDFTSQPSSHALGLRGDRDELTIERALRSAKVDKARAECARYNAALLAVTAEKRLV